MKITYDAEVDVSLSGVARGEFQIAYTPLNPLSRGDLTILDYDKDGNIMGLEILDASKRMENPGSVEYAVAY